MTGLRLDLSALRLLPGLTPAQEARCPGVANLSMSVPISATIVSAVRRPTPGIVSITCSTSLCWRTRRATSASSLSTSASKVLRPSQLGGQHEALVRPHDAEQRLFQRLKLLPKPTLRHIG